MFHVTCVQDVPNTAERGGGNPPKHARAAVYSARGRLASAPSSPLVASFQSTHNVHANNATRRHVHAPQHHMPCVVVQLLISCICWFDFAGKSNSRKRSRTKTGKSSMTLKPRSGLSARIIMTYVIVSTHRWQLVNVQNCGLLCGYCVYLRRLELYLHKLDCPCACACLTTDNTSPTRRATCRRMQRLCSINTN